MTAISLQEGFFNCLFHRQWRSRFLSIINEIYNHMIQSWISTEIRIGLFGLQMGHQRKTFANLKILVFLKTETLWIDTAAIYLFIYLWIGNWRIINECISLHKGVCLAFGRHLSLFQWSFEFQCHHFRLLFKHFADISSFVLASFAVCPIRSSYLLLFLLLTSNILSSYTLPFILAYLP